MFSIPLRTSKEIPTPKEKRKTERTKEGRFSSKDMEKSQLRRQGHHIPYHSSKHPHFI
jgi:hypothetical protein